MFNNAILEEVSSRMILFLSDSEPEDFLQQKVMSIQYQKLANGKCPDGDFAPVPVVNEEQKSEDKFDTEFEKMLE